MAEILPFPKNKKIDQPDGAEQLVLENVDNVVPINTDVELSENVHTGTMDEAAIGRQLLEGTEAEIGKTALLPELYPGTSAREDTGYKFPSTSETTKKREDLWEEFDAADANFKRSANGVASETFYKKEGARYIFGLRALKLLRESSVGMREIDISSFSRKLAPKGNRLTEAEKAERIFMADGLHLFYEAIEASENYDDSLEGARATIHTIHTNLRHNHDAVLRYSEIIDITKSIFETYRLSKDVDVLPVIEGFQSMIAHNAGYESREEITQRDRKEAWLIAKDEARQMADEIKKQTPPPTDTAA